MYLIHEQTMFLFHMKQEHRMRFEIEEMTLQMQYAVLDTCTVCLS